MTAISASTDMPVHRSRKIPWSGIAKHSVLLLLCLWVLLPLAWVILSSLKSRPDLTHRYIWPKNFADPIWARYQWIWQDFSLDNPFYRAFWNSAIVTSLTVVFTVVAATLAAYALTFLDMPGARVVMVALVTSLFFPTQVTAILGIFKIQDDLGLINQTWSLMLPYTAFSLAISIFVMRGVMQLVPREILDAARLDGANSLRVLFEIVVPLVSTGIIVVVMLSFSLAWSEFALANILMNDTAQRTLPVFMGRGAGGPGGASLFIVALLPALIVMGFAQHRVYRDIRQRAIPG